MVSPEILQENPELVEKLAESFELDVDMARYIVGNDNNSINFTGQPEFFKKIVSGVKVAKAFNVVKKIAPNFTFAINAIAKV